MREGIWLFRRLVTGVLIALALLAVLIGWSVYRVWRGDPLPIAGPMPVDATGRLYWVAPDPELGGFSVWEQPANLDTERERTTRMIGCPAGRCTLFWMDLVDGEVEYVVLDQGYYRWRGDHRERLAGFNRPDGLPPSVEARKGSIYLHGDLVLPFEGQSGGKFAIGYLPFAISPDGRFVAFHYPGYSSSDRLFLAHLLQMEERERGNYAVDVETQAIYRLPDGTHLRWK